MENKTLVIVESPGKIKKIQEYLGNKYIVKACCGHVRDLDKKTLSIDIQDNFKPLYIINPDKKKIVSSLKTLVKSTSDILLGTDMDREGEAIAQSLVEILHIKNPKRISFNEITQQALTQAVLNPGSININIVNAQQTRRILDRMVGYMITPLLWKLFNSGTQQSTGRVQSSGLSIIIDKENDIKSTVYKSKYNTTLNYYIKNKDSLTELTSCAILYLAKNNTDELVLSISSNEENNTVSCFNNEDEIYYFLNKFSKDTIIKIIDINVNNTEKAPPSPFITSTLQQEAFNKLKFSIHKTMTVAQKLYESGYITYMRTDSTSITESIVEEIRLLIKTRYNENYIKVLKSSKKKKHSQEAHECIRPTKISVESIGLSVDENKLYNLIWKRTVASQMANQITKNIHITIDILNKEESILVFNTNQFYFYSTLSQVIFDGFTILYKSSISENDQVNLNNISLTSNLEFIKLTINEDYNNPPVRYTEGSLVKCLEKKNIGRPSTYVSIIQKLFDKKYIELKNIDGISKDVVSYELSKKFTIKKKNNTIILGKETQKIVPTENGYMINDFMVKYFKDIVNVNFTAEMEICLDNIANSGENWISVVSKFYSILNPIIINIKDEQKNIINTSHVSDENNIIGKYNNSDILYGTNKFGKYIKVLIDNKWKYVTVYKPQCKISENEACYLLQFPKVIGKINGYEAILCHGKYGIYISHNKKNYSLSDNIDIDIIDIDYVRTMIDYMKK